MAEETEALNRLLEKRAAADSDDADRIDEKKKIPVVFLQNLPAA